MADRVPLVAIGGSLVPWVTVDLPVATLGGTLAALFVSVTDVSSSGSVVVELRDGSTALATATIPAATRSIQLSAIAAIAPGTALFVRVTSAGTGAGGLSGWFEVEAGAGAVTAALTTLALVKEYQNLVGSAADALLANLILRVSERIRVFCGRDFVPTARAAEFHDGQGDFDWLQLDLGPLIAGTLVGRLDAVALPAADLTVENLGGPASRPRIVYTPDAGDPSPWPRGRRNLDFDYSHGYASIPNDIVGAATEQVVWDYKRTGASAGRLGERSNAVGGATSTFMVDPWAPGVLEVIRRYRPVGMARWQ